jgi:hypothetical protein
MSYDKNTIDLSDIDNAIEILESLGIPYQVTILGKVIGHGINDCIIEYGEQPHEIRDKFYIVRKLEYKSKVLIEQMQRTHDCDSHDFFVTLRFKKDEEPKNLPLEIYIDEKEYKKIVEAIVKKKKK